MYYDEVVRTRNRNDGDNNNDPKKARRWAEIGGGKS
jgi:hypothetical protein